MVILSNTGEQSLICIPRAEPSGSVSLSVRSKRQNKVLYTATPTTSYSNGNLTLTWTPASGTEFVNENFYYFELTEGSTLLWRGQGYCTSQTDLPKYSIDSGKFTQSTSNDNTFLTI